MHVLCIARAHAEQACMRIVKGNIHVLAVCTCSYVYITWEKEVIFSANENEGEKQQYMSSE